MVNTGARFIGRLEVAYLTPEELDSSGLKKQHWEVIRPFAFASVAHGLISVHPGTFTDMASVPRIFKPYLDGEDRAIARAAVIHDRLYAASGWTGDRWLNRKEADEVLREAMLASGARWTQAQLVYGAVRAFGWLFWKGNHDHED